MEAPNLRPASSSTSSSEWLDDGGHYVSAIAPQDSPKPREAGLLLVLYADVRSRLTNHPPSLGHSRKCLFDNARVQG